MEQKITKKELNKISLDFRHIASRLLRTDFRNGMDNLRRFFNFIDTTPIIYTFIAHNNATTFDIATIIKNRKHRNQFHDMYQIPYEKKDEIAFIYQLLKYGLDHFNEYFQFSQGYSFSTKFQDHVDSFNKEVVLPFVEYINSYLKGMMIDMNKEEEKSINIVSGKINQLNLSQDSSSIITNNNVFSNDLEQINKLIGNFLELLQKESLPEEDKKDIQDIISVTTDELKTNNPKKGILKVGMEKLMQLSTIVTTGSEIASVAKDIATQIGNFIIHKP